MFGESDNKYNYDLIDCVDDLQSLRQFYNDTEFKVVADWTEYW